MPALSLLLEASFIYSEKHSISVAPTQSLSPIHGARKKVHKKKSAVTAYCVHTTTVTLPCSRRRDAPLYLWRPALARLARQVWPHSTYPLGFKLTVVIADQMSGQSPGSGWTVFILVTNHVSFALKNLCKKYIVTIYFNNPTNTPPPQLNSYTTCLVVRSRLSRSNKQPTFPLPQSCLAVCRRGVRSTPHCHPQTFSLLLSSLFFPLTYPSPLPKQQPTSMPP